MPDTPDQDSHTAQPSLAELADSLANMARGLTEALPNVADEETRDRLVQSLESIHTVTASLHSIDLLYTPEHARQFERHGEGLRHVAQAIEQVVGELTRASGQVARRLDEHVQELEQIAQLPDAGDTAERLQATVAHVRDMATEMNRTFDGIAARVAVAAEGVATLETELREAREQALLDALTRVHSRAALDEHLAAAVRQGQARGPWCVLLIDVDEFEHITDAYGQIVGDALLLKIASLIESAVPQDAGKCFLARNSSQQFALVLSEAQPAEPMAVADAIRASVVATRWQRRDKPHAGIVHTTVTIGGTAYRPNDTVDTLLERAAKALRDARDAGGNRTVLA